MTDWQNAVVVDPKDLNRLQTENAKLGGITRRQRIFVLTLFGANVLTATEKDAMEFGKQDRFVIVVPPGNANA